MSYRIITIIYRRRRDNSTKNQVDTSTFRCDIYTSKSDVSRYQGRQGPGNVLLNVIFI